LRDFEFRDFRPPTHAGLEAWGLRLDRPRTKLHLQSI
jgi:hypothetical protein